MKFQRLEARLAAIEPEPVNQDQIEYERRFMEIFPGYFEKHLADLGLSNLIGESREALATVGPRPFGHSRPDDKPVWTCIHEVADQHDDLIYRILAAEALACADACSDLGESEDSITTFREIADNRLRQEKRERQTTCDLCGSDLSQGRILTVGDGGKVIVVCWACSSNGPRAQNRRDENV